MCLLVVGVGLNPRYPFIFAGNRDEFHARPTAAACWWSPGDGNTTRVLGGRDLQAGGTWLGVDRRGRFATVTNFREGGPPAPPDARSRGELVTDFLSTQTPDELDAFERRLQARGGQYGGFNLLYGGLSGSGGAIRPWLRHIANRGAAPHALNDGIHTLSNRHLNTPWPKATRLRRGLEALAADDPTEDALFGLLADRTRPDDDELPDTGIPLAIERLLSSAFIVSDEYGTRASTVILADEAGRIVFTERSFDAAARCTGERRFEFGLFDLAADQ